MISRPKVRALCAALLVTACLSAEERNGWPLAVQQERPDGTVESAEFLGPLLFESHVSGQPHQRGLRPLALSTRDQDSATSMFLYPLFVWKKQDGYSSFSFFNLINHSRQATGPGSPPTQSFDLWPFYFSRDTGNPADDYRALFPLGGTIKNRFGKDRIHFVGFPFYSHVEKAGMHTTHAPWPFLRFIDGAGHHGAEFWPFYGRRGRDRDYDKSFLLWPLFYKSATNLSGPTPDVKIGALPFYTRDTGPGYISENYAWPFFGYTHRTIPDRYDEQRYFWPFVVQAQGDQRFINRWAPFYTHSTIKGYDKTWLLWPVYRHARWEDAGLAHERKQVLFFLYWSATQRSTTNPAAAPARKTHFWPLLSSWDNGAGRRQMQFLSPLEVFFPHNEPVRQLYTPLFALYRYDRQSANASRHSLLWNAVTFRRDTGSREFHLGPLFSTNSSPAGKRVALGNGLLAWRRAPGQSRWKFSLFDFRHKPANIAGETSPP